MSTPPDVATIKRDELKPLIDSDRVTLVEVLPEFRYRQGHLPGALNMPPGQVRELAPRLLPDKNADVVVYCGGST